MCLNLYLMDFPKDEPLIVVIRRQYLKNLSFDYFECNRDPFFICLRLFKLKIIKKNLIFN
jgi:hypothetical protein